MNSILSAIPAFFCGVVGFTLLWAWRKSAFKWNTWFPPLKRGLEAVLSLVALAIAIGASYSVMAAENIPVAIVAVALGMVSPMVNSKLRSFRTKQDEVKRGTAIASADSVQRKVKALKKPMRLHLGSVPLPFDSEPYHILVSGSTGTGKSVAINHILHQLRKANETVIIVDSGGDFLARHYQADTDFIFNPFDERCVNWSPTLEMGGEWDAEAMARSIVPDGVGDSKEWNGYAQTLVACVMRQLWLKGKMTLKDFLYYVQAASVDELQELLKGTAAAAQLSSARTFGSIRTIASNYLTPYIYLPNSGQPFSISEMIKAEHSGFLYITYRDDQLDSLRGLIACLLDVASRAILSLTPDPSRRIWLIIDEFSSIGKIQSIEAVATKARKAGGCLLVGIQSVSQLRDRYGEHGAQSILSCLSTWLVLRSGDADTAEYMSKYIGDVELLRQVKTSSVSDTGETLGANEQQTTQRAVMPSEIQSLPNLHGFLKLAGNFPICEVQLDVKSLQNAESSTQPFFSRDFKARPLLSLESPAVAPKATAPAIKPEPSAGLRALQATLAKTRKRFNELPPDSRVVVSRSDLTTPSSNP